MRGGYPEQDDTILLDVEGITVAPLQLCEGPRALPSLQKTLELTYIPLWEGPQGWVESSNQHLALFHP